VVLLDGKGGTGKSASLLFAASAARKAGYIVLYIPSLRELTTGSGTYIAHTRRVVTEERTEDDLPVENLEVLWYDRPEFIIATLATFVEAHRDQLQQIALQRKSAARAEFNARTVLDLAKAAQVIYDDIDRQFERAPRVIGDIFLEIIEELKIQQTQSVVIALDEFNFILGLTQFAAPAKRRIHSRSVRAAQIFMDPIALGKSMRCGFVLAATTKAHPSKSRERKSRIVGGALAPYSPTEADRADPSGAYLIEALHNSSAQVEVDMISKPDELPEELPVDEPVTLHCSPFSKVELETLLYEYIDVKYVHPKEQLVVDRLHAISGGRGHIIHRIVSTL